MISDCIIAGIGWRSGTSAAEVIDLIAACLAEAGHSAADLKRLVTIERKAADPVLAAVAAHFAADIRLVASTALAGVALSGSLRVAAAVGTPSVAEAGARLMGQLILPRRQSAHATCALALGQAGTALAYRASDAMASSTLVTSGAGR